MIHVVLGAIGQNTGADGLAALRLWGQMGERSAAWVAAADPVHLEARLDHLCLHALEGSQADLTDLRSIFDFLQSTFGSDELAFVRIGRCTYLRGDSPVASAAVSSVLIDGLPPDEFMPLGPAAETHHRLLSEVQMALHEHSVNTAREVHGLQPINSIWLWGGGRAPDPTVQPILPLFADDPLFRGFWLSRSGLAEPWTNDFAVCAELAEKGFVAVTPRPWQRDDAESPDQYLAALQDLQKRSKIDCLTLLFRDGLRADINYGDRFRLWRRESSLLAPP